jgi:hypothetical protein
MVSTRKHPANCEKAAGHVCKCGNCGGSQHGWSGWVEVAREPEPVRTAKRAKIISALTEWWSARRGAKPKLRPKEVTMDLVRIDCANWLAREAAGSAPDSTPVPRRDARTDAVGDPVGRSAAVEVSGTLTPMGEPDGFASQAEAAPVPFGADLDRPDAVEQVAVFAQAMTKDIWQDVLEDLGGSPEEIRAIRLQLADHGWCDLFIGFVQVLEMFGKVVEKIPDKAKEIIAEAILGSSKQKLRSALTKRVVDKVVDKAWAAFKAAMIAHSPLFSLLSSDDLLRNLRMIAVFICPAPEKHEEVRKHAVDPLLGDACDYISDETKKWLATQFKQWANGVARPAVPGSREGEGRSGALPPTRPSPA